MPWEPSFNVPKDKADARVEEVEERAPPELEEVVEET